MRRIKAGLTGSADPASVPCLAYRKEELVSLATERFSAAGASFVFLTVTLASATALHAQETVLPGGVHTIAPAQMDCITNETVITEGPNMTVRTGCDGARSTVLIESGETLLPHAVSVSAGVKRVAQFRIDDGTGAGTGSWLPVHVVIPVHWVGRGFNDSLDPTDISAYLAVNSLARLTEGTSGNPSLAGRTVSEVPFEGFTHGGPNGCLSVPKGAVSAAITAVKCVAGFFMKEEGNSHVDLLAVLQTGVTYNVEVDLQGEVYSLDTGPQVFGGALRAHPRVDFESDSSDPFGLSITGDIRVTVGTSIAAELQDLQNQINTLREDLENHTHVYLTGRGVGQNNVVASTGAAIIGSNSSAGR
jgi:hypothetical protein